VGRRGLDVGMSKGRHSATRRWKRRIPIVIVFIAVFLVALAMAGTAYAAFRYDRSNADRVLPGIKVEGVDVGGMERAQAIAAVNETTGAWLSQRLTVKAGKKKSFTVTPAELGLSVNVVPAVDRAFGVADSYSWVDRVIRRLQGEPVGASFDVSWAYDKDGASKFVKKAAGSVLREPVDASVAINDQGVVVFTHSSPGRELDPAESLRRIRAALHSHDEVVKLPLRAVKPQVPNDELGKTIVVRISSNTLTLYDGFKVEKRFRVATAAPGYTTPLGSWLVINKAENPTWINPAPNGWGAGEPATIPPGPGNPLGTRALYLNAPGIRIHGTYDSGSIGTYASHGCIRMNISDSEDLYPRVPVGTPALIVR
jgi:lipoprotein-anchoring transpeptidase ErfK/SrfK